MDKYITDIVQVYLSIFYFLIPLSDKPNSLIPSLTGKIIFYKFSGCFV